MLEEFPSSPALPPRWGKGGISLLFCLRRWVRGEANLSALIIGASHKMGKGSNISTVLLEEMGQG